MNNIHICVHAVVMHFVLIPVLIMLYWLRKQFTSFRDLILKVGLHSIFCTVTNILHQISAQVQIHSLKLFQLHVASSCYSKIIMYEHWVIPCQIMPPHGYWFGRFLFYELVLQWTKNNIGHVAQHLFYSTFDLLYHLSVCTREYLWHGQS